MGKSIRSKIKKKFRAIKREILEPFVVEKLKEVSENAPLPVRPEDTPESIARRNDPRKQDNRMGCAAFALAFPGGATGDHLRRHGVGNPLSCPPEELEKQRAVQREVWKAEALAQEEDERSRGMEVEKTIKKKKLKKKKVRHSHHHILLVMQVFCLLPRRHLR
jgi:hypothetical protein